MPSAWTVIDSETLAAPASSVSFTGIDTGYRMFRVTAYVVKDGTNGNLQLRLNNDSGSNYDQQNLSGISTSVSASRVTGQAQITFPQTMTGNQYTTVQIDIAKQLASAAGMVLAQQVANDTIVYGAGAGRWNNTTDLISRIDLIASAGNFAAGTTVVLEGM